MPRFFLFIFFSLKISPLDQTLRPTCKFLMLALFYIYVTMRKKISENLVNKKKINTVHNLSTFSIVFTNKNGLGGAVSTLPPPKKSTLGVLNTPSKLRLKATCSSNNALFTIFSNTSCTYLALVTW